MSDYSQHEYEMREAQEFQRDLREVERAPLSERKEAAREFAEAMRDHPHVVGERVGWLIDGNYGYGAMQAARRVVASKRMNRVAALTQMAAALEWKCPQRATAAAWNKLSAQEKAALDREVKRAIRDAESE